MLNRLEKAISARTFVGPPVVTGTYTGAPVTLPMTGLSLSAPIGSVPVTPRHTAPEFGVTCQGGTPDPGGALPGEGVNA